LKILPKLPSIDATYKVRRDSAHMHKQTNKIVNYINMLPIQTGSALANANKFILIHFTARWNDTVIPT